MESELRQTFYIRFEEMIPKLRSQIENYCKTQATLQSDLDLFRYSAYVEFNPEMRQKLARPLKRSIVCDPSEELDSEDAANSVFQLLGFLWEYPEVFDAFSANFLVPYCKKQLKVSPFKVDAILELVTHRLFTDLTDEVMDWRVVVLQERFIKQVIDEAETVQDIIHSPLLLKYF